MKEETEEAQTPSAAIVGASDDNDDEEAQHTSTQRTLREVLQEEQQDDFDNDLLHRAVEDAGRWAFGTVFVEVWVLNDARTHLIRPGNGWWIDPAFCSAEDDHHGATGGKHYDEGKNLMRLIDPSNPKYLMPEPLPAGCGLPGILWAESQTPSSGASSSIRSRADAMGGAAASQRSVRKNGMSERGVGGGGGMDQYGSPVLRNRIHWREVNALANDPDQPYNPRLIHLAKCGLGWAAGVPFKLGGSEGIVVYMARQTIDQKRLKNPSNESYLSHATLLIGAAYSLRLPRRAAVEARKEELHQTVMRVKAKLRAVMKMGSHALEQLVEGDLVVQDDAGTKPGGGKVGTSASSMDGQAAFSTRPHDNYVIRKIQSSIRKFFGANVQGPPVFSWEQALFSFLAAFVTLMIITNINKALVEEHGPTAGIVLGPFGALMTLQYGLTAAPASQPRNAIVGQLLSLVIAQSIGQIDEMEVWLRQSLATALAIGTMVKLGITHPPAGAAALLFSSGRFVWDQVWIMLFANVVAILAATLFNNLHDKRQYPTFWGFGILEDLLIATTSKAEKIE